MKFRRFYAENNGFFIAAEHFIKSELKPERIKACTLIDHYENIRFYVIGNQGTRVISTNFTFVEKKATVDRFTSSFDLTKGIQVGDKIKWISDQHCSYIMQELLNKSRH